MTSTPAQLPVDAPARPARRWVHVIPIVVVVLVFVVAGIAGTIAFSEANSDSLTRPAAPFQAFLVWAMWLFPLIAGGIFTILLAYLVLLPARSLVLRILHIVLTCLAAVGVVAAIMLVLPVMATF
jgi:hypothetical protein